MISEPTRPARTEQHPIIDRARHLMQKLQWLSPLPTLNSTPSSKFGRQIESSLADIAQGEIVRLQLRKRDAAVVMSASHYEEMVQMKALYADLIEQLKAEEIASAADDYEALYQRITSPTSRQAADSLFSASVHELGATWQPGKTEKP